MKLTITLLIAMLLSGCTTTGTTKLETAIKEKLKDENNTSSHGLASSTMEPNKGEIQGTEQNNKSSDIKEISALNWTSTGDPHHITQCYFGHGHDSELFKMIAQLPIDFTCTLDNGGVHITKPTSDDTQWMTSYTGDHMQARRAFVCVFNESNELVKCEDFAGGPDLDNRWRNLGVVKGLVVHCKRGEAVSRTALTEVE